MNYGSVASDAVAGGDRQMRDLSGCVGVQPPFEGQRFKKTLSCASHAAMELSIAG